MAKAQKKGKSSDVKVKKKKWVEMKAPFFNNHSLGQTTVAETEQAIGKNLKVNLMYLAGDPRKQNTNVLFEVNKQVTETQVDAKVLGYEIQQPTLRKLVRRGKTKIQDSFRCYTADKVPIVIKSFVVTRNIVNKEVARTIRRFVKDKMLRLAQQKDFEVLLKELLDQRLQKSLKGEVAKIYPLRIVEFNTVKIVPEKGDFEAPEGEPMVIVTKKSQEKAQENASEVPVSEESEE